MALDQELTSLTQADFDAAEATLLAAVQADYPTLDLRKGTALRELLIRPAAYVYALDSSRLKELQDSQSLIKLNERISAGETVTDDEVNAVLSNFGSSLQTGDIATGKIKIYVAESRNYTLTVGTQFTTLDNLVFTVNETVIVSPDPEGTEIRLETHATGYYFIVNAQAAASGVLYNIPSGTSLVINRDFYGYVAAESYTTFTGGTDSQTVSEAISSLPTDISYRALDNLTAITAKLQENFATVSAVNAQAHDSLGQLRGKNNAFGIAIPGFVDILPRTFFGPVTETVTVTGTRIAANTYSLTIPTDSLSVYYRIKSITDADSYTSDTSAEPLGSYGFSVIRTGTAAGSHVFSTSNPAEFVNTVYQTLNVTVTEVGGSDAMKDFKVVLYTAPSIPDIQSYIDGPMVRNLGTDILVRAPFVCLVDVTLRVYHNTSVVPDIAEIEEAIFNVINGKNFDTKLTRSDLVRAISPIAGVLRIDLTETGFKLNGTVIDGLEVELTLTGDMLDIDSVSGILSGLSASTCVFATELDRINVTLEVDE